jgi:hypothetical protein
MRNSALSLAAFGPIRDMVIFLLSSAHGIGFLLSRGQGTKHLIDTLEGIKSGNAEEFEVAKILPLSMYAVGPSSSETAAAAAAAAAAGSFRAKPVCSPQVLGILLLYSIHAYLVVGGICALELPITATSLDDPLFKPVHDALALANTISGSSTVASLMIQLGAIPHLVHAMEQVFEQPFAKTADGKEQAPPVAMLAANLLNIVFDDPASGPIAMQFGTAISSLPLRQFREPMFRKLTGWCSSARAASTGGVKGITDFIEKELRGRNADDSGSIDVMLPITMGLRMLQNIIATDRSSMPLFCVHRTGHVLSLVLKSVANWFFFHFFCFVFACVFWKENHFPGHQPLRAVNRFVASCYFDWAAMKLARC